MVNHTRVGEEAIGWLIRQREPAFDDWDGLTAWLEADIANAAVYAEISAKEDAVAERLTGVGLARGRSAEIARHRPSRLRKRAAVGGLVAMAASVLAVIGIDQFLSRPSPYEIATSPGDKRVLTLEAGTTVSLNGATIVRLDRNDPRFAELKSGEALFTVTHDASRPFRVKVGEAELVDLGTKFAVVREKDGDRVAVSEGVVMFNPDREAVRLTPGNQLSWSDASERAQISKIPPQAVGSWIEGRLIYENAPLSRVASDLSRSLGQHIETDPSIARQRITAVVQIPNDEAKLPNHLERLLDVYVRPTKDGWILTPKS